MTTDCVLCPAVVAYLIYLVLKVAVYTHLRGQYICQETLEKASISFLFQVIKHFLGKEKRKALKIFLSPVCFNMDESIITYFLARDRRGAYSSVAVARYFIFQFLYYYSNYKCRLKFGPIISYTLANFRVIEKNVKYKQSGSRTTMA